MKEKIKALILAMKFDKINSLGASQKEILDVVSSLGMHEQNILAYYYLLYCVQNTNDKIRLSELHQCANFILQMGLNFISGAYKLALFHALQAIELQPLNIEWRKSILVSYKNLPESVLDDSTAKEIENAISKLEKAGIKDDSQVGEIVKRPF